MVAALAYIQQMRDAIGPSVRGDWLRGGTGIITAGALSLSLLQPRIRATFA